MKIHLSRSSFANLTAIMFSKVLRVSPFSSRNNSPVRPKDKLPLKSKKRPSIINQLRSFMHHITRGGRRGHPTDNAGSPTVPPESPLSPRRRSISRTRARRRLSRYGSFNDTESVTPQWLMVRGGSWFYCVSPVFVKLETNPPNIFDYSKGS